MKYQPLVSIAVITYNSSATVLETLDSVYNQTYPNIELIISDDCSKDNTVTLCRDWVEKNRERFVRTEIITVGENSGVSANLNRALGASHSEWVKTIAGDDMFLPNCVSIYMEYVRTHPDMVYAFSKIEIFGVSKEMCKSVEGWFDYSFFDKTLEDQYQYLQCHRNSIPAASGFCNKKKLEKFGIMFDERIPLLDDYPMWLNLLRNGVHLDFINKVTVKYRVSETALSTSSRHSEAFMKSNAIFYKLYRFEYEYKHVNKKQAIENWLRAQNTIYKNIFWHIVFKMYKIVVMHKMH